MCGLRGFGCYNAGEVASRATKQPSAEFHPLSRGEDYGPIENLPLDGLHGSGRVQEIEVTLARPAGVFSFLLLLQRGQAVDVGGICQHLPDRQKNSLRGRAFAGGGARPDAFVAVVAARLRGCVRRRAVVRSPVAFAGADSLAECVLLPARLGYVCLRCQSSGLGPVRLLVRAGCGRYSRGVASSV